MRDAVSEELHKFESTGESSWPRIIEKEITRCDEKMQDQNADNSLGERQSWSKAD